MVLLLLVPLAGYGGPPDLVLRSFAAAALVLLAVPTAAVAQSGNPFGPVAPSPAPAPPPQPAPPKPPVSEADDGELGTTEVLGLAGVAVLLIGGVAVVIAREGRRLDRRARRGRRPRRPGGRPTEPRKRGTGALQAPTKAPPPPPRKRRSKGKRR